MDNDILEVPAGTLQPPLATPESVEREGVCASVRVVEGGGGFTIDYNPTTSPLDATKFYTRHFN